MVLLNSRNIWLEEARLKYQFVNAFLDRIQEAMLTAFPLICAEPQITAAL